MLSVVPSRGRHSTASIPDVRFEPLADIKAIPCHVHFSPKSGPLLGVQLSAFNTQAWTGLPAPLGTAIKINPKSLKDSAFFPATAPAPVYLST
jgi:hypothetical protein